jgi:predicted transposase YdaD
MLTMPHDALFKLIFGRPEAVAPWLAATLPAELSAQVDWFGLRAEVGESVGAHLDGVRRDLLFSAGGAGIPLALHVGLEHQSTDDPRMLFRFADHAVRAAWDHLHAGGSPSRVPGYVAVLVLGDGLRWRRPRRLRDHVDVPRCAPSVEALFLDFEPLILSFDGAVPEAGSPLVRLAAAAIGAPSTAIDVLADHPTLVKAALQAEGRDLMEALVRYCVDQDDRSPDEVQERIHAIRDEEVQAMSITQRGGIARASREEGFNLGIEQGIARGIEQGIEQGIQQGIKQGIERGLSRGAATARQDMARRTLRRRFGDAPQALLDAVASGSDADQIAWIDAIIDARSLDELLNRLPR